MTGNATSRPWPAITLLALASACGGGGDGSGSGGDTPDPQPAACEPLLDAEEVGDEVVLRFETGGEFFGRPFPDDTRLLEDGSLDLSGFPNERGSSMLDGYLEAIGPNTRGWGPNAAIYLPWSGPLHPDSLPAGPADSRADGAGVYLVDVDPDSPERGARVPLEVRWQPEPSLFLPGNVLILAPVLGVPLRDGNTYAAVVTTAVQDAACRPLPPASGEQAERIRALELPAETVAGAAVFATMEVLGPMERIRDAVLARPRPSPRDLRHVESTEDYHLYEGRVRIPVFQDGDPPYLAGGGRIHFDDDGAPVVQREEDLRIALAMPVGSLPDRSGWPLVLVSHGTGGDYRTFVRSGTATQLTSRGMAALGFDQVLHGDRDPTGTDTSLTFVNVLNIVAARDNMRQGGADGFVLMHMARSGVALRTQDTPNGVPSYTDAERVLFLGHSEGALTGPPFVAVEPGLMGAVFSGAGALLKVTLLQRKDPVDFPRVARDALNLEDDDEELDLFHPVPNLLQTFIEPAEPANFAPWFALLMDPAHKSRPTPFLILQGLLDTAVPADSSSGFIAASGADLADPVSRPIPAMDLRGQAPVELPIEENINGVTAGALQFPDDGHFALYDNATAARRTFRFLESAAAGEAVIPR